MPLSFVDSNRQNVRFIATQTSVAVGKTETGLKSVRNVLDETAVVTHDRSRCFKNGTISRGTAR